jgi:glycosyltransferase involved in cell wall biosynthesis
MPLALEQLNMSNYDLVISSESGPAKGIITDTKTKHICYCHTPMRYLWNMYHEYKNNSRFIKKLFIFPFTHYLRIYDQLSAERVDHFIANSNNVANRIKKYYRRDSVIIYPPVETKEFYHSKHTENYYLMVGQLVHYKRFDLAISTFNNLNKKLIIIGDGEEKKRLKSIARSNITFLGYQSSTNIKKFYSKCRALIFPGEDDFGIVPIEAMASGRPVIAYKKGGALESIAEGKTGVFFQEQTTDSLTTAINEFEKIESNFSPQEIMEESYKFDTDVFNKNFHNYIYNIFK